MTTPSRTAALAAPPPRTAAGAWILGPLPDLALFLATPILILPVILGARAVYDSEVLSAVVMAFGAMGHHLPGMLRAYGDRALFHRFRTRFVLAPVVLGALCVGFAVRGSSGMLLVAYGWGVWHGWMQTYGFLRIYDAKVRAGARSTARWDFAVCATWFLGGVVFADTRVFYVQRMLGEFGLAPLAPDAVTVLRGVCGACIAAATIGWLLDAARQARAGAPTNPLKFVLVATSAAWWWYANVAVADILLGLILFEIFHDVQYLTIVWLFNRGRVERDPGVGAFTRFVFRRSPGLVALYLAMVFAYGGLGPLAEHGITSPTALAVGKGLVVASSLLHFYFDGFLWKVREPSTRASLGIDAAAGQAAAAAAAHHGMKWALLLVLAAGLWFASGAGASDDAVARASALAASSPGAADAHFDLGTALGDAGQHEASVAEFDRALAIVPDHRGSRVNVVTSCYEAGLAALAAGREADAQRLLARAGSERPELARYETEQGHGLWQQGRLDGAVTRLRAAAWLDPRLPEAHLNLALAYRDRGDVAAALQHAERGAALLPADEKARQLVAELRARSRGR